MPQAARLALVVVNNAKQWNRLMDFELLHEQQFMVETARALPMCAKLE